MGKYTLDRRVAMGGMAEIWSALDSKNNQTVALKVLLPELAVDQTIRTMFLDEVRLTMRLQHPNIVRVDGVFEVDNWLFQAMELLEGKDVRRLLSHSVQSGQRFPVGIAVMIAATSAQALAYAHALRSESGASLEIVHRDISPHNILVCADGTIKVLDFGIARAKERATKTAQGVIKGKLSYMAPEQAIAQPVTFHADIFSLGIVLWEMLAMRRLFSGASDAETLALVCDARVPSLCEITDDVPESLDRLVAQMLELRPRNRPNSMRAVENGLKKILHQLEDVDISEGTIAQWLAPMMEDRPRTQVRVSPQAEGVALKETRAETPSPVLTANTEDFDSKPTTTLKAKPVPTDTTLPSPVTELKTEALDIDSMNQTLQEPDETELLGLPSMNEIESALAEDQTFEADFSLTPDDGLSDTIQGEGEQSSFASKPSTSGLVVEQVGAVIRNENSAKSVDPLAATSLYSSEQKESLSQSPADSEKNSGVSDRDLTKSGPLLSEANKETARTAPILDSLDELPSPTNAKGSGSKLLVWVLIIVVGIVLWMVLRP